MRVALALFAVAAIAGAGVYVIRAGSADSAVPDVRPQVEGRILQPYSGESDTGGIIGWCEVDAVVDLEGGTVVNVVRQGRGPDIRPGDRIMESLDQSPRPGAGQAEVGSLGQIHTDTGVYWGKDGKLHAGCAPESVIEKVPPVTGPPRRPWE